MNKSNHLDDLNAACAALDRAIKAHRKRKYLPVEIWLVYIPYTDNRIFPWEIRLIKWFDDRRYQQEYPYISRFDSKPPKGGASWKSTYTTFRGRTAQRKHWEESGRRFFIGEL